MLMASLRLNIPVIFCFRRPDGGRENQTLNQIIKLDLVDAMIQGADPESI
ncbi:hypothetical protein ACLK10_20995 [Escherichia coli]